MARARLVRSVAPLLLVAGFVAACSSSTSTTVVVATKQATGKVACNSLSGTLAFVPPLTNSGTKSETTTVTVSSSGCTTSGSNVSTISSGHGVATIHEANNSCAGITMSKPVKVSVVWKPVTVRPTTVSFSGYSVVSNASGDEGFALPENGGSATVSGSFSGSGSTASATAYSSSTAAQIATACGSTTGLTKLTVSSGNVSIG